VWATPRTLPSHRSRPRIRTMQPRYRGCLQNLYGPR
jgi:hypothetical protein